MTVPHIIPCLCADCMRDYTLATAQWAEIWDGDFLHREFETDAEALSYLRHEVQECCGEDAIEDWSLRLLGGGSAITGDELLALALIKE